LKDFTDDDLNSDPKGGNSHHHQNGMHDDDEEGGGQRQNVECKAQWWINLKLILHTCFKIYIYFII